MNPHQRTKMNLASEINRLSDRIDITHDREKKRELREKLQDALQRQRIAEDNLKARLYMDIRTAFGSTPTR